MPRGGPSRQVAGLWHSTCERGRGRELTVGVDARVLITEFRHGLAGDRRGEVSGHKRATLKLRLFGSVNTRLRCPQNASVRDSWTQDEP